MKQLISLMKRSLSRTYKSATGILPFFTKYVVILSVKQDFRLYSRFGAKLISEFIILLKFSYDIFAYLSWKVVTIAQILSLRQLLVQIEKHPMNYLYKRLST
jgi:hypothetical protein